MMTILSAIIALPVLVLASVTSSVSALEYEQWQAQWTGQGR